MDLGESGAWPIVLADHLDRVVSLWHAHRLSVAAFLLASVLLVWLLRRRSVQHALYAPSLSPASEEKGAWIEETTQVRNSQTTKSDLGYPKEQNLKSSGPKSGARKVIVGQKPMKEAAPKGPDGVSQRSILQPHVFFTSLTGTTSRLAEHVYQTLREKTSETLMSPLKHDIAYLDLDDYFISGPKTQDPSPNSITHFYILVLPSYDIDTILTNFLTHLEETHHDFRIDTAPLLGLAGYAVFGIGDKQGWPSETAGFCQQAIRTDRWMAKLTGGKRAYPLGMGDVKGHFDRAIKEWTEGVSKTVLDLSITGNLGQGVPGSGDALESGDEESDLDEPVDLKPRKRRKASTIDVEDVGGKKRSSSRASSPQPVDFTTALSPASQPKQMVPLSSPTHTSLTKQGYSIIGSHSGVKICRWTKSALRGRGSCYKYSFYGIKSHLCMETTPSLSCSNKCVFCWRHGTNPVSTTWRWVVDPPDLIFEGAKREHYKKIKMMRGVPGVRAERFAEAMRIRHCALSLVGEPVFYPRINEFIDLLHSERISTFLVCNAQHPPELARLKRVTQLYVSIDAGTKAALRAIDRPLHRDFWERTMQCLDIVRARRRWQRTVYRLTLVKAFNVAPEEVAGYADLIARGLPCFVEIKGVTYCGTSTSKGAGLTMGNVPFYTEVLEFVELLRTALAERGLAYGVAAEHAHSCCVLLADEARFCREGRWRSVIDYGRYFELLEGRGESEDWGPEDYCALTPEWAAFGRGGFDPADVRVDRKGRLKEGGGGVEKEGSVEKGVGG